MTSQELAQAGSAVQELSLKCFYSKPDEIAKIEKTLQLMGLTKLAEFAHREGINNCGDDYLEYLNTKDYLNS